MMMQSSIAFEFQLAEILRSELQLRWLLILKVIQKEKGQGIAGIGQAGSMAA
jgi:hypothetical protein